MDFGCRVASVRAKAASSAGLPVRASEDRCALAVIAKRFVA
jgi:hypothetical protein